MNPIIYWLITNTISKGLARRCPKCYRRQIVPKEKENYTVQCKWCDEPIPPKQK